MSRVRPLLYWIASGFLLSTWEGSIRSLGMPFGNDTGEKHTFFGVDRDVHIHFKIEGVVHILFGNEGDKLKHFGDEGDGHKHFEDDRHKGDKVKDETHKVYGAEDDGHEDEGHENEGHKDDRDEDGTPPTDSSAPMGLRGYRRYFANDSLIGRPVPCTRDDKICFRHNLLFVPTIGKCRSLLEDCGNGKTVAVVIKEELEHKSGRVVGICPAYADPCRGYRMAFDGLCYRREIVRDVICGYNATLSPHILGGMECREEPLSPISVQQPKEDGLCVVPDLRNSDPRSSLLRDPFFRNEYGRELKCSSEQASCFSTGHVFVPGHERCHVLLMQGPCADDHVVALDAQAALQGRAEGTCVHVRGGCPKGYKRMLFDGQCHEDREVELVAPAVVILDAFGRYFPTQLSHIRFRPILIENRSCIIDLKTSFDVPQSPVLDPSLTPLCGPNDSGHCKLYDVEEYATPKPEFDDRK